MNKLFERIGMLGIGIGMLATNIAPAINVFAADQGTGDYQLTASIDSNADWVSSFTVDGVEFNSADRYLSDDGSYFMTFELHIPNEDVKENVGIRTGGGSGAFDLQLVDAIDDGEGTHKNYVYTANYTAPAQVSHVSFNPYSENGGGGPVEPGGNFVVNVNGLNEEDGTVFVDEVDEDTVAITFATLWHMKFVGDITVNDQTIPVSNYIDYNDQKSYLDHYNGQIVSFTEEFARADDDVYNITVTTARNEVHHIGNFLWTADPRQADKDDYIGNAKMEPVSISFTLGDVDYACNEESVDCPYVEFDSGSENYDDGSLVVPAGATLTMRVIPDYGYQVMNVNMSELTTSEDGVGEFSFVVPGGAAYFKADVVPVEDKLNSKTELVAGGSIDLGDGQTSLNHGSARLDVADVELTDENIAAFEDAAGDYKIKNYLDISLYNMTCRGGTTCDGTDDDAWNERVRELNEPATITLQLEDGVDGNDVVIVHEKHDGTYEIIETTYDAEKNTITFTTSSFSNYAIASRTVAGAPNTGENTMSSSAKLTIDMLAIVAAVAVAGILTKVLIKR